jgi:hypothetical protein
MTPKALSFFVRPLLLAVGVLGIAALYFVAGPLLGINVPDWKSATEKWPEKPKTMAQKLVEKYGEPNEITPSRLIWNNNGPWKRTILYGDEIKHNFPAEHTDFLEQTIDYEVPVMMFEKLAIYDGSVIAERTKGEISARCDKEEANFLAINLAHEIVTGKRNVFTARNFYGETMAAMTNRHEVSPYMQKLMFTLPKGDTGDPDQPYAMKGITGGKMKSANTASSQSLNKKHNKGKIHRVAKR